MVQIANQGMPWTVDPTAALFKQHSERIRYIGVGHRLLHVAKFVLLILRGYYSETENTVLREVDISVEAGKFVRWL